MLQLSRKIFTKWTSLDQVGNQIPAGTFGRMWTRFNYFVGIETALIGGKLIFGNRKLSPEVAIVGVVVSLIWYVMGGEDRFLVRSSYHAAEQVRALSLVHRKLYGDGAMKS
jgi:hypothetical protein